MRLNADRGSMSMNEETENMVEFKRTKKINYRMSFLAMLLTQSLLFSFEMSIFANIVAYIVNLFGWLAVGGILECIVAVRYKVDLNKK